MGRLLVAPNGLLFPAHKEASLFYFYGVPSTGSSTNASFSSPSSSSFINAISGSGGNSNSQKSFIPSGDTVSTQRLAGRIGEILQAERDNSSIGHRVFNTGYAPYYNFGTFG